MAQGVAQVSRFSFPRVMTRWLVMGVIFAFLVLYFQASLFFLISVCMGGRLNLSDYLASAQLPDVEILPLPILDLTMTAPFSQEELDKYLHIVKRTHAPVILRSVLSKQELARLTDEFYITSCNNTIGKFVPNNHLEASRNIDLKTAFNVDDEGGLFQALNCCGLDMADQMRMPSVAEYWDRDNSTALVVARNFHTRFHAHPDHAVHFATRNSKRWVILHEQEVGKLDVKFGRHIPLSTNIYINQSRGLKRWEFTLHEGDMMIVPPWGFHGLEYLDSTTSISFLASIYNHDVLLHHPILTSAYMMHLAVTNWRIVVDAIVKNPVTPLGMLDSIHRAVHREMYSKY